jgi:hypothetical protein
MTARLGIDLARITAMEHAIPLQLEKHGIVGDTLEYLNVHDGMIRQRDLDWNGGSQESICLIVVH